MKRTPPPQVRSEQPPVVQRAYTALPPLLLRQRLARRVPQTPRVTRVKKSLAPVRTLYTPPPTTPFANRQRLPPRCRTTSPRSPSILNTAIVEFSLNPDSGGPSSLSHTADKPEVPKVRKGKPSNVVCYTTPLGERKGGTARVVSCCSQM